MSAQAPNLYGIIYSNRDFSQKESWGKNQFNSSFPAALALYLQDQGLENNYLTLDSKLDIKHCKISTTEMFGVKQSFDNVYFSFESVYTPYQPLLIGETPRVDLVVLDRATSGVLKGIEIKLTALPDNTTCELSDTEFGCEIVIRPDTIVYLACSIAMLYKDDYKQLRSFFAQEFDNINNWSEGINVLSYIGKMYTVINNICLANLSNQVPIVMQPIWKTEGKKPVLSDNCLDVFVWSNFAFIKLFTNKIDISTPPTQINRQTRTLIWLFKMLFDFSKTGRIDHKSIIDKLTYNTKNDKAFAISGSNTSPFMSSSELTNPRIKKSEIKNIILGGGQNLLSPERRFDAIIYNSPNLF